jgi:hypothetical protein
VGTPVSMLVPSLRGPRQQCQFSAAAGCEGLKMLSRIAPSDNKQIGENFMMPIRWELAMRCFSKPILPDYKVTGNMMPSFHE